MNFISWLLAILFPPKCILCRRVLKSGEQDLCRTCRQEVPLYPNRKFKPQFLDSLVAVWYYDGIVRRSLLRYKFYNARHYAPGFGRLLAQRIERDFPEGFDVLTWVPVSPQRKLRRGYDQVELLAKNVGRELGVQPLPTLQKIRHNRPQSGIRDAAQRRANALGAYREVNREAVCGKRILLLDDIFTTGATSGECARVLRSAGAKEVHCAAVAASRK